MIENVEFRWLTRKTGHQVIDKYGMFRDGEETVLQYRKLDDSNVRRVMESLPSPMTIQRTGVNQWTEINYTWSEWKDVPTVHENSAPVGVDAVKKCPKCGIMLEGTMSYYCSQPNCPTGLGSSIS